MGCSICTNQNAVLVDREHKGTYWMCGDCAFEMIEDKMKMERVVRAAEDAWPFIFTDIPKALNSKRSKYEKLYDALEALPEHLRDA